MQRLELIPLEQTGSDFLRLNLRERAIIDARVAEVDAFLWYSQAFSEYRAAVATDLPEMIELAEQSLRQAVIRGKVWLWPLPRSSARPGV